jgi:hypothetical protein
MRDKKQKYGVESWEMSDGVVLRHPIFSNVYPKIRMKLLSIYYVVAGIKIDRSISVGEFLGFSLR